MEQPTRAYLGQALRGVATSAVDISDGLVGDLVHILRCSQPWAFPARPAPLPGFDAARASRTGATALFDLQTWRTLALASSDDYELAFTAPADGEEQSPRAAPAPRRRRASAASIQTRSASTDGAEPMSSASPSFDHFG